MNKVILLGRLTDNPELKHTPNGIPVATFTLAVNRAKSKDKQADFIDVVAWRGTGEFCSNYFSKGQQIGLVGSIQVRNWKDKDGNNRKSVEVVADEVYFADSKKDSNDKPDFEEVEMSESELPF